MSSPVPRLALVLHRVTPGTNEERLGRILTFFGVPWEPLSLTDLASPARSLDSGQGYAVLGSIEILGAVLAIPSAAAVLQGAAALYGYATQDGEASMRAWSALAGGVWTWRPSPGGTVPVTITPLCPELTGSMSGLRVDVRPTDEDGAVTASEGANEFVPIVSVQGAPAFLRADYNGVPVYFCASTAIVDIDAPVGGNFYDVKAHFLAAVPLVMFVTSAFRSVMWRPLELGACLIIDDPLLKFRYGCCDFRRLRDLMRQHHFTTNIAFIPWNWRRTTRQASEFFRSESDLFSVSVHGCDHIAAEFGETSVEGIGHKARLAQVRMMKHQERTGIQHDPVMVFPQGVFSSTCPGVLKRNGFVAAINTEISPMDTGGATTLVRDVWDVAILRYGSFAIYTRRYSHHGLENFAFDLLLGKPCFIVAHHEFFNDNGAKAVSLVGRLTALDSRLRWRSPREVIRRAYRRRQTANGVEEVEMYGNELSITNPSGAPFPARIRKRETESDLVSHVESGGTVLESNLNESSLVFDKTIAGGSQSFFRVVYAEPRRKPRVRRAWWFETTVACRRLLSEFRDEYVYRSN